MLDNHDHCAGRGLRFNQKIYPENRFIIDFSSCGIGTQVRVDETCERRANIRIREACRAIRVWVTQAIFLDNVVRR